MIEEPLFADMVLFPVIRGVHVDDIKKAHKIIRRGRWGIRNKVVDLKNELYK